MNTQTNLAPHYIAFSVHGTNAFIVATNKNPPTTPDFTLVPSRRENPTGQKYTWTGLTNKKTGKPYVNPSMILARFNHLERCGWSVDSRAFRLRFGFKIK